MTRVLVTQTHRPECQTLKKERQSQVKLQKTKLTNKNKDKIVRLTGLFD